MNQGIIYLITNKVNGYKYVGQTTESMNKVWKFHIQESNRMSSKPLHKAFRKYGIDKFNIKQIDECDISLLDEKEQYWIKHYDSYENKEGYNDTLNDEEDEDDTPIIKKESNLKPVLIEKAKTEPWGFLKDGLRGNGSHSAIKIKGIHIETGEIRLWDSATQAAIELTGTNKSNGNILLSARKGYKCYGYKWELLEDKTKKKAIFGVNKKTGMIGPRYTSIRECARELGSGGVGGGIIKSLRNPGRYSWKGYYWYYS